MNVFVDILHCVVQDIWTLLEWRIEDGLNDLPWFARRQRAFPVGAILRINFQEYGYNEMSRHAPIVLLVVSREPADCDLAIENPRYRVRFCAGADTVTPAEPELETVDHDWLVWHRATRVTDSRELAELEMTFLLQAL